MRFFIFPTFCSFLTYFIFFASVFFYIYASLGNRIGRKDLHGKHDEAVEEYPLKGLRDLPFMVTDLPLVTSPPGEDPAKLNSSAIRSNIPTITTANKTAEVPISTIRPSTGHSKRPFVSKASDWSSTESSSSDSSSLGSLSTIAGPNGSEKVIAIQSVRWKPHSNNYSTAARKPKRGTGRIESVPISVETDEIPSNTPPTVVGTKSISPISATNASAMKNGATTVAKTETAVEASAFNDNTTRIPPAGTKVDESANGRSNFRVSVMVIRGDDRERDAISRTVQTIFCRILRSLETAGAVPRFLQSMFDSRTCSGAQNLYETESSRYKARIRRQLPDNDPCHGLLGKFAYFVTLL